MSKLIFTVQLSVESEYKHGLVCESEYKHGLVCESEYKHGAYIRLLNLRVGVFGAYIRSVLIITGAYIRSCTVRL